MLKIQKSTTIMQNTNGQQRRKDNNNYLISTGTQSNYQEELWNRLIWTFQDKWHSAPQEIGGCSHCIRNKWKSIICDPFLFPIIRPIEFHQKINYDFWFKYLFNQVISLINYLNNLNKIVKSDPIISRVKLIHNVK